MGDTRTRWRTPAGRRTAAIAAACDPNESPTRASAGASPNRRASRTPYCSRSAGWPGAPGAGRRSTSTPQPARRRAAGSTYRRTARPGTMTTRRAGTRSWPLSSRGGAPPRTVNRAGRSLRRLARLDCRLALRCLADCSDRRPAQTNSAATRRYVGVEEAERADEQQPDDDPPGEQHAGSAETPPHQRVPSARHSSAPAESTAKPPPNRAPPARGCSEFASHTADDPRLQPGSRSRRDFPSPAWPARKAGRRVRRNGQRHQRRSRARSVPPVRSSSSKAAMSSSESAKSKTCPF